jgi:Zn-dependent protease/CBS domain-containing protein
MFNRSVRLFRLWGIPVELNFSWIIVLGLITWIFATESYPERFPGFFSIGELWILGFLTAILLFTSILLHEFSHSLVASRNGLPIRKITLFMFGGVAQMDREVDNPTLEMKMAAAGPLMTMVLIVVFYSLSLLFRDFVFVRTLLRSLAYINLGVLVFNLVPGFPLDGGRILRAAIWYRSGNLRRATRIASNIGNGFGIFLIVLGFFTLIFYASFIGALWLIFIGYFLRRAAQSSYLMVSFKQTLGNLRVADIMRTIVVSVSPSVDLRTLVDEYFIKYHYGSFPVVENDVLIGIVSLDEVKRIKKGEWSESTVADVVNTSIAEWALNPSDPAERLLRIIMKRGFDRLPVVDGDGHVVGIVARRDLLEVVKMINYLEG